MVLLMGIREEELVQRLISMDSGAPLQDLVTCCRSYEAARNTASAIQSSPSQLFSISAYRRGKRRDKAASSLQQPPSEQRGKPAAVDVSQPCQCCSRRHSYGQCPAVDSTCSNCGRKGHWAKTARCPAKDTQCRACKKTGHYDKCCRLTNATHSQNSSHATSQKKSSCRSVTRSPASEAMTPKPVCIHLTHGGSTSHLQMLPDTGADVTVIGQRHLSILQIPRDSLQPLPPVHTLTADGSEMAPALGCFQATLRLGQSLASPRSKFTMASRPHSSPMATARNWPSSPGVPEADSQAHADPPEGGRYTVRHSHTTTDPFAFQQQVKDELDSMVRQGIIEPAGDEPSAWCHPLVVVAKDKGVRITVDLTKLNSQVSRPAHPAPTPYAAVRRVTPSSRFFTTADALCGYWQLVLDEKDRHLTTFITPFGRFRHCRGPMGFAATGDAYCHRGDLALQGLENCVKRIHQMLSRCREHGITLNKDKFSVAEPQVRFCGYNLSPSGISAGEDRVSAIRDFPTPANLTDLRSFMGLVNQLSEFTPDIAAAAQLLRPLLSPKRTFTWTADHDEAFNHVKTVLLQPPVLAHFDPALPVVLQTDASRLHGIGYALLQDHGQGCTRLVQCGSRFLTDAETRYATIELELLAVVWAMSKCRLHLIGLQHFTLMTDHRPLVPILNAYTLDAIENPRLQRLKEKISPYLFTAVWRAGKLLRIPDALSRAPVSHPTPEDEMACTAATAHLRCVVAANAEGSDQNTPHHDADRTLQEFRAAARADPSYAHLTACLSAAAPCARLHDSHRGVEATRRRARQTVFWPGIDSDIANTVRAIGLLELRNSPNYTGRSPSQHLYGHPLRSCVPAHPESFSADWQTKTEECDRRAAARAEQVQAHYDQHARPLPKLCIGATVRIQDPVSLRWDKVGVVMGCSRNREYDVRLPSGRVWRRNRRLLRPLPPHGDDPPHHIPVVPCSDEKSSSALLAVPVAPRRSQRLMGKSSARDSATSVRGEGGSFAGVRAAALARPFLSELGMISVPQGCSISEVRNKFTDDGECVDERTDKRLTKLVYELVWYGSAIASKKEKDGLPE
ncbi:uncharacterized protein LOC123500985 [Portunus trituberculatus]|uniref:uncharacterized protein LOC123500985 n=1 Tax=Portunus trituberculatus TaxID=210409 RepID=UPI001E1CDA05|nr:uncharacterized protein LOC123500985 [Portunus trituberculatus]